jgi:hypothetical protein
MRATVWTIALTLAWPLLQEVVALVRFQHFVLSMRVFPTDKVMPFMRELEEVRYRFEQPFVIDSTDSQTTFGLTSTPLDVALTATVDWWLEQRRAAA